MGDRVKAHDLDLDIEPCHDKLPIVPIMIFIIQLLF